MRPSTLLAALLVLAPLSAFAENTDFKGLDLTEEQPERETKKKDERLPASAVAAEKKAPDPKLTTEVEIASEDRVKSVQRKAFLKRGRLELTPEAFTTVNDAFFPKYGVGVRAAFFFHDSLGLALRFNQYNDAHSDNVRLAKRELQSMLPSVLPKTSYALDVLWSPIYGKMALANSIRTFDLYLVGGVGAIYSQTSSTDGAHLSTHLGLGERFSLFDYLAVDLSAIDTLYSDRPGGANKSVIQHMISINLGFSFFLPLSFEYKEP